MKLIECVKIHERDIKLLNELLLKEAARLHDKIIEAKLVKKTEADLDQLSLDMSRLTHVQDLLRGHT